MQVTGAQVQTMPQSQVGRDLGELRETVGKVVGSVFYGAMLKTMRESSLKGKFGHGGRGEDVFAAQLHGVLAERMGNQTQRGVAETLYRHLEKQQSRISAQRDAGMEGNG